MQTTTRHYKTLRGLINALDINQLDLRTFNRGAAYSPKFRKYLKFSVSDKVAAEYYNGIASVLYKRPKAWQVERLKYYTDGIASRLWYDSSSKTYEYCAGQDYPAEIRFIQYRLNKITNF